MARRSLAVALVLLGLARPAVATSATTPTTDPRQRQLAGRISSLKGQVDEASAEEAKLLDQIDASGARRRQFDAKVAELDAQIAPVANDLATASTRLDDLDARQQVVELQLDEARARLDEAKDRLRKRAVAAYTSGPLVGRYANLLLGVRTFEDLMASSVYVSAALHTQNDAVRQYQRLSHAVGQLRDALDEARGQALGQRNRVAAEKARLDRERADQDTVRGQAAAEVANQQHLLEQARSRKQEFQGQISALQRQSDSIAAQLRSLQSGQGPAPSGHGVLSSPIPGAPITSGFGPRVHPIYGDVRPHTGIDFGAPAGTPIHAAADGTVVSAGPLGGYGNATVLDHGNSLATLYGHQSRISVSPGQRVSRGQVIGAVGCTGLCTGPHLHFEVRVNGTPVDPMNYL